MYTERCQWSNDTNIRTCFLRRVDFGAQIRDICFRLFTRFRILFPIKPYSIAVEIITGSLVGDERLGIAIGFYQLLNFYDITSFISSNLCILSLIWFLYLALLKEVAPFIQSGIFCNGKLSESINSLLKNTCLFGSVNSGFGIKSKSIVT